MTSRPHRAGAAALLVVSYLALTAVFTYPLAPNLATHHVGEASGDAKGYLWNYWWTERALFEEGTSPFETDVIFHPIGIGLAFHTLGFLQGVEYAVLREVVSRVTAANLVVLWTFLASALATYALARSLGAGPWGSFLAGAVFAFCPYRLARLAGHYDLLGTEWIPLYALLLLKLVRSEPSSRRVVPLVGLTALAAAACGYTAMTYLVFLVFFTLVVLIHQYRLARRAAPRVAALAVVTVALLAPLLHQALVDQASWTYPSYPGASRYVADAFGYLVPSPRQSLLGPFLGRRFDPNLTETSVFIGFFVTGIAIVAIWIRRRLEGASLWLLAGGVFYLLSLGSSLHVFGTDTGLPLPFALLAKIPVLDNLRAPSRFAILTVLALAMLLALAWTQLVGTHRFRAIATAFAVLLIAAEYVSYPTPLFAEDVPSLYRDLAKEPGALAVVEIPGIEQEPVETMYHQTFHEKPMFIGTVARVPREKSDYYLGLPLVRPLIDLRKGKIELSPELLERERENAPRVARFLDIGYFVIDRGYEKRGVVDYLEAVLPVDRWYEDEAHLVLRLRREELPPEPRAIDAGATWSRQHFESGWLPPEREQADDGSFFRWSDRERATFVFRRPSNETRSIVFELAPLDGLEQSVSVELDDGRVLGERALTPGFQEVAFRLPKRAKRAERAESAEATHSESLERLWLRWKAVRRASDRDPRRLAARVRSVRFE